MCNVNPELTADVFRDDICGSILALNLYANDEEGFVYFLRGVTINCVVFLAEEEPCLKYEYFLQKEN